VSSLSESVSQSAGSPVAEGPFLSSRVFPFSQRCARCEVYHWLLLLLKQLGASESASKRRLFLNRAFTDWPNSGPTSHEVTEAGMKEVEGHNVKYKSEYRRLKMEIEARKRAKKEKEREALEVGE
jgi:hypothetical protein